MNLVHHIQLEGGTRPMASNLLDLNHVWKTVPGSETQVCVLDTGAVIGPEGVAMLAALKSRSVGGLTGHLRKLAEKGFEEFMQRIYLGYGHGSVGDLAGGVMVVIEGASMLAIKVFQDWLLYVGQESSTRYIPFTRQFMHNPLHSEVGNLILENWRRFYLDGTTILIESLKQEHPIEHGEDPSNYERAVRARALDIMRGFLPAGTATDVAWVMSLRQFRKELAVLRHHPLDEVRAIALTVEDALIEKFPSSFNSVRDAGVEEYREQMAELYSYFDDPTIRKFTYSDCGIDFQLVPRWREALESRGRSAKIELPHQIGEIGSVRFDYIMDWASWRDIQRQRSVMANRVPLLTTRLGFEEWYLDQLPSELRAKAEELIASQIRLIDNLVATPEGAQYYTAMGFKTANRLVTTLWSAAYIAELRSGKDVHPTLRTVAIKMADCLEESFGPYGLKLHIDREEHRFNRRRGSQTIYVGQDETLGS